MEWRQTHPRVGSIPIRSVSVGALVVACAASCGGGPAPGELVGESSSAIQGGETDPTHTFAVGVVELAQQAQNMVAFCSGVLLTPNLVATARHCVAELTSTTIDCAHSTFGALYPPDQVFVTIDTTITMNSNFTSVTKVIVPSAQNQQAVCGNDLALLVLGDNITLSEYAQPVISPPMTDPQYEAVVSAIGYGIDTPTDMQGTSAGIRRIKENVALTCVPDDSNFTDCFTADPTAKSVLTAGEFVSGDSTCEGDSGSGAFEQGNFDKGKWVAFGVLSRGGVSQDGTTCEQPIYTRFDAWGPLIVNAALQAAEQANTAGQPYALPIWAGGTGALDGGLPSSTSTAADTPQSSDDGGALVMDGKVQVAANSSGGCAVGAGRAAGVPGRVAALLAWTFALLWRRRSTSRRP